MRYPFRRYCFHLGAKLGKTIKEVMSMDATEIVEWMAYDTTLNPQWIEKYKQEQQKEEQANMSTAERAKLFHRLLGGQRDV